MAQRTGDKFKEPSESTQRQMNADSLLIEMVPGRLKFSVSLRWLWLLVLVAVLAACGGKTPSLPRLGANDVIEARIEGIGSVSLAFAQDGA